MTTYTPVKVGRGGKVVHAGVAHKNGWRTEYHSLCTVVNTHNINSHPHAVELPPKYAVTCKHCLAIMAEEAAKEA